MVLTSARSATSASSMETSPVTAVNTKLCQQKPVEVKENPEKLCPVTMNPRHTRKAFKVMNELRSQNLLCDVTIVAEDVEITAHKVVLAACSPYFHAMFTGEMSESRAKRVRIKEVDGWTLKLLVDYVYTAEIKVTEENVQVLLPAASLLQLQDVRKTCCEFLESQLHPTNCLGIRAFADMHACTELLHQANTFAEQHFSDIVQGEEFLNLGIEQVCSLIASDKLTVVSEEKVFEAVITWVSHDKDVRQEHMAHLMEHVRLPLLSRDYLVQRVEEETLVKNSSACKDYLIEAMKYHLLPGDQRTLIKSARTRQRTPVSLPKSPTESCDSESDSSSEEEPIDRSSDLELQQLLERLRSMSRASFPVNDYCFQDDPHWAEGEIRHLKPVNDREGQIQWCQCTHCISLPTRDESVCCHEVNNLRRYISREVSCVTLDESFRDECLDEHLLISHLKYRSKISKKEFLKERAKFLRKAAYRSFESWAHGFLAPKHRFPIPACVVSLVRSTFPDPPRQHAGLYFSSDYSAEEMAYNG
ncbi:kelch-like protein 2 isoform X3 [Hyla sarda]|uniref:kelch-like protein 2 isoform X3 n=1 Tax=Hyla sarda TaxID=327740 RepID=UPI0024C2B618|nr:kelch-like protein 2 isoform X3 [Hyla sarda]